MSNARLVRPCVLSASQTLCASSGRRSNLLLSVFMDPPIDDVCESADFGCALSALCSPFY